MPGMSAAIDCRRPSPTELVIAHPHHLELRVTVGRGWWDVWEGKDLYASIPPNRRCLASTVAAYWRLHRSGSWEVARPMPRFWGPGLPGGDPADDPAEAPTAPESGTRLLVARTEMQRIARHLTAEILAPLQARLDPAVLAVWRRVAACAPLPVSISGRCAPLEAWFWDHPFLVRDVLALRGAAMVVRAFLETYDDPDLAHAWEVLQTGDWLRACCPGTQTDPYRALCVTLSNCPGRLPVRRLSLLHLRGIRLLRPRRTRLELITALAVGQHALAGATSPNRHLILEAEDALLRQALPSRQEDLFEPVTYAPVTYRACQVADLLDFPDECPDLLTLARCSAEWHVVGHLNPHPSLLGLAAVDPATATAIPPREPPAAPAPGVTIRRLATVGEVLAEGRQMRHCVGQYAARAQAGLCFLYHVEVDAVPATVELDRRLRLVQARGPGNSSNAATRYAEQRLGSLGATIESDECVPF